MGNEEITLMNWGNAIVRKKTYSLNPVNFVASVAGQGERLVTELELELHLEGDVKKTSKKVTWLSQDQELVPLSMFDFDYLITKDKPDPDDSLEDILNKSTETKTEALADRKGFFRIDKQFQHGDAAVAFQIPTGKKM